MGELTAYDVQLKELDASEIGQDLRGNASSMAPLTSSNEMREMSSSPASSCRMRSAVIAPLTGRVYSDPFWRVVFELACMGTHHQIKLVDEFPSFWMCVHLNAAAQSVALLQHN